MLTGKQRRHLRSLGHHLKPLIAVGKGGITPGLVHALDQALHDHELVKVRVGQNTLVAKDAAAEQLAIETASEVAQTMGSTVLLYRAHPKDPTIVLPAPER